MRAESACGEGAVDRVRAALTAIAAGQPVVVADDAERENEGDLIFAAALATPALLAFTVRHTSGLVCVALLEQDCDRLELPPMCQRSDDPFATAYRVTVDVRGTGTGISAADRARTIAALANPESQADNFTRPGHVLPLLAKAGGVLTRRGHTEAAVDLARLAGLPATGALCEIVSVDRPTEMARGPELARFSAHHGLVQISIADLVEYRTRTESAVRRVVRTPLPTQHGRFAVIGYEDTRNGTQHLALVTGSVNDGQPVPIYVHTECLSGDVFHAMGCQCRRELTTAMENFANHGRGVVIYLRPDGPVNACGLLNARLPDDTFDTAGWILKDLEVHIPAEAGAARLGRHSARINAV